MNKESAHTHPYALVHVPKTLEMGLRDHLGHLLL